mmetsp:Transcript_36567/g.71913  ORF Transcript_36567/g.71913 Transcript_36567/m.71913 type:complete len:150 (+) Transcript_36567:2010-2459(+)
MKRLSAWMSGLKEPADSVALSGESQGAVEKEREAEVQQEKLQTARVGFCSYKLIDGLLATLLKCLVLGCLIRQDRREIRSWCGISLSLISLPAGWLLCCPPFIVVLPIVVLPHCCSPRGRCPTLPVCRTDFDRPFRNATPSLRARPPTV